MKLGMFTNIAATAVIAFSTSAVAVAAQEVLRFGHVYEEATPYHAAMINAAAPTNVQRRKSSTSAANVKIFRVSTCTHSARLRAEIIV